MGDVYLAEQSKPLRRRVAVKVLREDDSGEVLERFEYERDVLARMEHPFIATVLDAGTTTTGRAYFAMEYAEGTPITEHCDGHRMIVRERLELFQQVCDAVQHAHQKGVIHRDIKPTNVMVTAIDGIATPKVIDFGIARATSRGFLKLGGRTRAGEILGTPGYMSPEQAAGGAPNVDTRTDVYSLGVLLYELITGVLPIDSNWQEGMSLETFRTAVLENDPPRPSDRFASLGERRRAIAEKRGMGAEALARELRGDLDWIALRAVDRSPERRYGSPVDLSADISRYFHREPIQARPPSKLYRLGKFIRRHRAGTAVAATAVVALLLTSVVSTFLALRIARERDRADQEVMTSRQVSSFLADLFRSTDPRQSRGSQITAREVLERGRQKIHRNLASQPALQARLMNTMASVYLSLGLYSAARELAQESFDIRMRLFGDGSLEVAESRQTMGSLSLKEGEAQQAEQWLESSLRVQRSQDHPDESAVARTLSDLAEANWYLDRLDDAERLYSESLEMRKRLFAGAHEDIATNLKDLADIAFVKGEYQKARERYDEALHVYEESVGRDSPYTAILMNNYGEMLFELKDYDSARPLLKDALEISRHVFGDRHPDLAGPLNSYGRVLLHDGRIDEARALFREALDISESSLRPDHPDVAMSLDNLGACSLIAGDYLQAEKELRAALDIWMKRFGDDNLDTVMTQDRLAVLYTKTGRYGEARPLFEHVLMVRQEQLEPEHADIGETLHEYSILLEAVGEHDKAVGMESRAQGILSSLDLPSR